MSAQSRKALALANEVRLARSAVKHDLFARKITLADALGRSCVSSMRVFDLVAAQRGWGPARTINRLAGLQIGMTRTVGQMTERQRLALIGAELRDERRRAA